MLSSVDSGPSPIRSPTGRSEMLEQMRVVLAANAFVRADFCCSAKNFNAIATFPRR
jgi:hypothetical protein